MKKTKTKTGEISSISRKFLFRKFLNLYLHSRVSRREFARLILKKKPKKHRPLPFHTRFALALFVVAFGSVVLQLAYPSDRALPFSRLEANGYVGFRHDELLISKLRDFDSRIAMVHTHQKDITTSYRDLGVRIDVDKTFEKMSDYSTSKKLIPFSILFVGNKTFPIERHVDDPQLSLFVSDVVGQIDKLPVDAIVTINGTELAVNPSEDGFRYEKQALFTQVHKSDLSDKSSIVYVPTVLDPRISTYSANNKASLMQTRINTPMTIVAEEKTKKIDSKTIASWVEIIHEPQNGDIQVIFDKGKIKNSLADLPFSVDKSARDTIVTLLNGSEAGRLTGKNGRTLQLDELVDQVFDASNSTSSTINARVKQVLPKDIIERRYTKDSLGMQSLLNYWTQTNSGEYGIVIKSLNGNINANINPHRTYPSIGINRLYLAHIIYSRISAGSLSGSTQTSAGASVDWCIDKMIYESHQTCTDSLGAIAGWGANDSFLHTQGFESTTLSSGGITTADDIASWFKKLNDRSITSFSQADTLLSIMSRQVNRSGIPSGSSGIGVANKAGSFGRIVNDAGLVYHPSGNYILSVLSEGSTYSQISDLTAEINKVISQ